MMFLEPSQRTVKPKAPIQLVWSKGETAYRINRQNQMPERYRPPLSKTDLRILSPGITRGITIMSFGNLNNNAMYAEARREDFLKEARNEQMVSQINKSRSGSVGGIRRLVGNMLVRIGERLQGSPVQGSPAELGNAAKSLGIAGR